MLHEIVAAYQVYGLKAAISAAVRGVIPPWRGKRVRGVGEAWMPVDTETRVTRRANQEVEAMMFDRVICLGRPSSSSLYTAPRK